MFLLFCKSCPITLKDKSMASDSSPEALLSSSEGKVHVGDVPCTDLPVSNRSNRESSEAVDKIPSIDTESSSARSFVALPGLITNGQDDIDKLIKEDLASTNDQDDIDKLIKEDLASTNGQDDIEKLIKEDLASTTFPEKGMCIKESLSKETSRDESSASTGSPVILSVKLSDCKSSYEESASTVINCSSLSEESVSIGDVPVAFDISESRIVIKAPCSAPDTKMERTVLDGMNASNANETVLPGSLVPAMNFSKFQIDTTPSENTDAENIKMLDFQRCDVRSIEDGELQRVEFLNQKTLCRSLVTPSQPCTYDSATFDISSASSAILNSIEESKASQQALKPSVSFDLNSNKLSEILSILENWARKGLDNAFNSPVNVDSRHIGADLEKDLKYGFGVMKKMINRIYTLMKAANKLPDPTLLRTYEREKNLIRCDLVDSGLTMWFTIQDLASEVCHDYKKLKPFCNNEKSTEAINMEKGANPKIIIANAYTIVVQRLHLLRKQMNDFHDKIRLFCSEIDEHL